MLIHPITKRYIDAIASNPPHALLLEGPDGIGKGALARGIAAQTLNLDAQSTSIHPFMRIVDNDGSISIDTVRELTNFVKLKIAGKDVIKRVIIVEHVGNMTIEAQNAFLKLLEEPPADTMIILTANNAKQLLPTIVSRLVAVTVTKPVETDIKRHFLGKGYKESDINKAYAISGGLSGLMTALLDDEVETPLLKYIQKAKELLGLNTFDRLVKVDQYIKQKDDLALLLIALDKVVRAVLESATAAGKTAQINKWHKVSAEIAKKQKALSSNPSSKLMLTDLVLSL